MLGERIILGNLGYIGLLTLIGAIYIGNRFHAEQVIRTTDILMEEVKELRAEAMATTAELMYLSKQSEVVRLVNERDLN
ncbi:MAG: FtsL-like putative cell division protein [Bacteroidales bacterium]